MNRVHFRRALSNFRLEVELDFGRETVVLFGPSGAGKSLTLRTIAGLLRPDSGEIVIGGEPLFDSVRAIDLPPQERRVGYVMQDYALFPHLSVAENITFGLYRLPPAERADRLAAVAAQLRLEGLEGRRPVELSGGQQQRVALARALVTRPRLLLLDEPFAALDTPLRARLRRELVRLLAELALPAILVTHDLAEAHVMADRMAVFDDGRQVQFDRPERVLRRPATLNVARFTGARNIFVGERRGDVVESSRGTLPIPSAAPGADGRVSLCIRPEAIRPHPPGEPVPADGSRLLPGTIVGQLDHGLFHTLFVHLDQSPTPPDHVDLEVDLDDRSYRRLEIAATPHWSFAIHPEDVHLLGPARPPYFEGPAPQPEP